MIYLLITCPHTQIWNSTTCGYAQLSALEALPYSAGSLIFKAFIFLFVQELEVATLNYLVCMILLNGALKQSRESPNHEANKTSGF